MYCLLVHLQIQQLSTGERGDTSPNTANLPDVNSGAWEHANQGSWNRINYLCTCMAVHAHVQCLHVQCMYNVHVQCMYSVCTMYVHIHVYVCKYTVSFASLKVAHFDEDNIT